MADTKKERATPFADSDGETPQTSPAPRPIFAIFEGGGAKGVAHVGALKAIKDNGLDIIGVAGTSAGALIAVMVAIGLEASDIMGIASADDNILTRQGQSPTGLLGTSEWKRFTRMKRGKVRAGAAFAALGAPLLYLTAPRITGTICNLLDELGHFSTEHIADFINRVIRDRLAQINHEGGLKRVIPEKVTFGDLSSDIWPTVIPLKIVVTDTDNGTVEIFDDGDATKDVVVAEAVAASISIPVLFKPAAIPSYRPGWCFAEEKLRHERVAFNDPPVPIVGFTLNGPKKAAPEHLTMLDYAGNLLAATLQGGQSAVGRFLDDVVTIPLTTHLGTLDFDEGWEAYKAAYEDGYADADKHLRFSLRVKPDRIKNELETTRTLTMTAINAQRTARGDAPIKKLRINVIRPFGAHSLRVMESVDMQGDADDRLLLDRRGRGAAEAFRERGLRVFTLGGRTLRRKEYMTKYERALLRRAVRTVLCLPIFEDTTAWARTEAKRPVPAGILAIDSDQDLKTDFSDPHLWAMLVKQSYALYAVVSSEVE